MTITVKMCGLTRPEDVENAIRYGASMLGFIVEAKSKRRLSVGQAAKLSRPASGIVPRVAVSVNPDDDLILAIKHQMRADFIQLHGDETPDRARYCKAQGLGVIKAVSVKTRADIERAKMFDGSVDYILLDAKPVDPNAARGGHGQAFDWSMLLEYKNKTPYILAGGLRVDRVAQALKTGAKFLDVASGIESTAGIKQASKIKAFMDAVDLNQGTP